MVFALALLACGDEGGDLDAYCATARRFTADNPAEVRPTPGDWETIPTVNNSYGYHRHDKKFKPAEFFVPLIAKAAAKGGNTLLNVGPTARGTAMLTGSSQASLEPSFAEAARSDIIGKESGQPERVVSEVDHHLEAAVALGVRLIVHRPQSRTITLVVDRWKPGLPDERQRRVRSRGDVRV